MCGRSVTISSWKWRHKRMPFIGNFDFSINDWDSALHIQLSKGTVTTSERGDLIASNSDVVHSNIKRLARSKKTTLESPLQTWMNDICWHNNHWNKLNGLTRLTKFLSRETGTSYAFFRWEFWCLRKGMSTEMPRLGKMPVVRIEKSRRRDFFRSSHQLFRAYIYSQLSPFWHVPQPRFHSYFISPTLFLLPWLTGSRLQK